MSVATLRLTNLQAITIHNVLSSVTDVGPAHRFHLGGLLRRIRCLGDYDPQCSAFRLLEPSEFEVRSPDGAFVLLPDGERKKGYKYAPEVLAEDFPLLHVSPSEQLAVAGAVVAILSRDGIHAVSAGAAADAHDIAEWTGALGLVADQLAPEGAA